MDATSSTPAGESLAPGSVFAGYVIVRLLGAGDFGEVYEAARGDEPRVALKVLQVDVQANPEIVTRFMREARAVALFKHPNIVASVEVGEHEGRPFLAMELLAGEGLGALMRREGRLPLGRALDIALPLMAAVRTVHAQNIVHRDLKPDNVFITTTPEGVVRPKILDFGFAKMAEPGLQLTGKDTAIGTPNFMSPEQMLSPRSVDPRSDQWALGVLLYYMLTGVKPFEARTLAETFRGVLTGEPRPMRELAPEVPEAVAAAVARAMRKPPAERFASVHDFAQAIVSFASDATALSYASDFYTVSVWETLGETPPALSPEARVPRPQRSARAPGPPRASAPSPAPRSSAPSLPPRSPALSPAPTQSSRPATRSRPPSSTPAGPPREEPAASALPELLSVVPAPLRRAPVALLVAAVVVAAIAAGLRWLL